MVDGEVVEEYTTSRANESEVKAFVESCFSNLADKYSLVRDNKESTSETMKIHQRTGLKNLPENYIISGKMQRQLVVKQKQLQLLTLKSEKKFSVKVIPEFDKNFNRTTSPIRSFFQY